MYSRNNVDPSGMIVTGAQLAIVFLVLFSYPLQVHPLRNSLDKVLPNSNPNEIPWPRFVAMTLAVMILSYFFAVTVSDLSVVLALVGATGSTTIGYILPGIFYFKFCQNQRAPGEKMSWLQFMSLVLVFSGAFIMVTSLANIIFGRSAGH
jgi:amino acid permease